VATYGQIWRISCRRTETFLCDCERTRGRASMFAILNVPRHLFSEFTGGPARRAGIDVKMTRTAGQNEQPRRGRL
jgi:hypothetical protein